MYNQTKSLLSLALIAAISLCAVDVKAAPSVQTAGVSPVYEQNLKSAIEAFNASDFEKSYSLFSGLFEIKPDDTKINFYLGRSALETKRYEEALSAFERVLIMEPAHIRSRLEMARAYFELKEFDAAEAEFDKALEADMPKNVRDQILSYKKAIASAKQKHFLSGYVMLGLGWDSNINNAIGSKEFTITSPFGDLTLEGDKEKSDYYHTQVLGLNHIWNLSSLMDGLFWQDGFTAYAQSYPKNASSSARYFSLNVGPGYRTKSYEISLSLAGDYLVYNSNSPYMTSYYASPKISYKITDTLIAEGIYTYKEKKYTKENKDRDSNYQEAYLGLKKLFPSNGSIITLGVAGSKEKAKNNNRTDVSNRAQRYSVSFYKPIIEGLDMTASISYNRTEYDEMDVNFLKESKDSALVYGLGIMKSITKSSMVTLNGSYTDNKSNIDNKVYNKKSVNLNYIYNF